MWSEFFHYSWLWRHVQPRLTCNELFFASCNCIPETYMYMYSCSYSLKHIIHWSVVMWWLVVGWWLEWQGAWKKYFITLELISLKWKLVPLLGASLNIQLLMTDILQNKTFLHWLSGWQLHCTAGSNQRLGVRSVVLVKILVCCWTHYLNVNAWSSDMTYWQSPLLLCGLFDFFALWLASDVSPAAGELRVDDLWWHVAWRF